MHLPNVRAGTQKGDRMKINEFVEYKTISLEKLKIGMDWKATRDDNPYYASDFIVTRITGFVWAQDVDKEMVRYPANWFEAFKERWFPRWLTNKYPVIYTVKKFVVKATYPDLMIQSHAPVMKFYEVAE